MFNVMCDIFLSDIVTGTDVVKLTVAHLTDRNVEIIQPLEVTDTHVIIQVHGLSLFGVLKALLFQAYPTRAQVLLFYKQLTRNHMRNKLHIHLLPGNVPVTEVICFNVYSMFTVIFNIFSVF